MKDEIIRVRHPDFGHVDFRNPTQRQKEVLLLYNENQKAIEKVAERIKDELEAKKDNSSQS